MSLVGRIRRRLGLAARNARRLLLPTAREQRVLEWFKVNGDKTLRLNYDLNETSMVLDLGGYEGQWTSDIFAMYQCQVHVFEPVSGFCARIRERFRHNRKITVHEFGLADRTANFEIYLDSDGSSEFGPRGGSAEAGKLVQAAEFFRDHGIGTVDLIKINIEGSEYELLTHFLDTGLVPRLRNIQVQFHDFVPHAPRRMQEIQERLAKTHELTYQYEFVWENWRLRERASG